MSRTGLRIGEGEVSGGGDLCAGSGVKFDGMEKLRATASVWGADEAFLSPPEYGSSLGASQESEESCEDSEEYNSGLAEEVAQSMLQEDEEASMTRAPWWGKGAAKSAWSGQQMASSPTSPQSPLSWMSGYNWEAGSPRGNIGSSGVSSPPTPQEGDAIDVLYADVLRLKVEDEVKLASQQILSRQQQIIQRPTSLSTTANSSLLDDCLLLDNSGLSKSSKSVRSKGSGQQPEHHSVQVGGGGSKQQVGGAWGSGRGILNGKQRREEGTLQHQQQQQQFSLFASNLETQKSNTSFVAPNKSSSGGRKQEEGWLRAVFLGSTASRECGGTGVFLPRRPQDSKRKPACSTVLLPSRIVHALNLKIEDTLPSPNRRDLSSSNLQWRRNPQGVSRRPRAKDEILPSYFPTSHATTLQEVAPDISLPSEWTY